MAMIETTTAVSVESKHQLHSHRSFVDALGAVGAAAHISAVSQSHDVLGTALSATSGVVNTLEGIANAMIIAKAAISVISVIVNKFVTYAKQKEVLRDLKGTVLMIQQLYKDQIDALADFKDRVHEIIQSFQELPEEDQSKLLPKVKSAFMKINLQSLCSVMGSIRSTLGDFDSKLSDYDSRWTITKWLWGGTYLQQWRDIGDRLHRDVSIFSSAQNVLIQRELDFSGMLSDLTDGDGAAAFGRLASKSFEDFGSRMETKFGELSSQIESMSHNIMSEMSSVSSSIQGLGSRMDDIASSIGGVRNVVEVNQRYLDGIEKKLEAQQAKKRTYAIIGVKCNEFSQEVTAAELAMKSAQMNEVGEYRSIATTLVMGLGMVVDHYEDSSTDDGSRWKEVKDYVDDGRKKLLTLSRIGQKAQSFDKLIEASTGRDRCIECQRYFQTDPYERYLELRGVYDFALDSFDFHADVDWDGMRDQDYDESLNVVIQTLVPLAKAYIGLERFLETAQERCIESRCEELFEGPFALIPTCTSLPLRRASSGDDSSASSSNDALTRIHAEMARVHTTLVDTIGLNFWQFGEEAGIVPLRKLSGGDQSADGSTDNDESTDALEEDHVSSKVIRRACSACCDLFTPSQWCSNSTSDALCACHASSSPQSHCPAEFDCSSCRAEQCAASPRKSVSGHRQLDIMEQIVEATEHPDKEQMAKATEKFVREIGAMGIDNVGDADSSTSTYELPEGSKPYLDNIVELLVPTSLHRNITRSTLSRGLEAMAKSLVCKYAAEAQAHELELDEEVASRCEMDEKAASLFGDISDFIKISEALQANHSIAITKPTEGYIANAARVCALVVNNNLRDLQIALAKLDTSIVFDHSQNPYEKIESLGLLDKGKEEAVRCGDGADVNEMWDEDLRNIAGSLQVAKKYWTVDMYSSGDNVMKVLVDSGALKSDTWFRTDQWNSGNDAATKHAWDHNRSLIASSWDARNKQWLVVAAKVDGTDFYSLNDMPKRQGWMARGRAEELSDETVPYHLAFGNGVWLGFWNAGAEGSGAKLEHFESIEDLYEYCKSSISEFKMIASATNGTHYVASFVQHKLAKHVGYLHYTRELDYSTFAHRLASGWRVSHVLDNPFAEEHVIVWEYNGGYLSRKIRSMQFITSSYYMPTYPRQVGIINSGIDAGSVAATAKYLGSGSTKLRPYMEVVYTGETEAPLRTLSFSNHTDALTQIKKEWDDGRTISGFFVEDEKVKVFSRVGKSQQSKGCTYVTHGWSARNSFEELVLEDEWIWGSMVYDPKSDKYWGVRYQTGIETKLVFADDYTDVLKKLKELWAEKYAISVLYQDPKSGRWLLSMSAERTEWESVRDSNTVFNTLHNEHFIASVTPTKVVVSGGCNWGVNELQHFFQSIIIDDRVFTNWVMKYK